MLPPRVVFISRRFWPLLGGAETVIARLSAALVAHGGKATILTARWDPHWPAEIVHRGVRVVRLPQSPRRFWGTLQYMRGLRDWLTQERGEFDLVYVSQLKHDAYVAVRAGRRGGFPVVLRAAGAGQTGDCHWHKIGRCGRRIRRQARRASAIVAPSPAIREELLAAGFPPDRVVLLANGVPLGPPPSDSRRAQARQAIAAANAALALPPGARLALYTGRLHEAKGLSELVTAWADVADRRLDFARPDRPAPDARLWLVGEGPQREALARQIDSLGLGGRVVLTGSFDNVDDLLAAADLFVLPSHEEGMSVALLEAMAAGLPIVASDIPGNRGLIRDGVEGLLVPAGNPPALAQAIERILLDPAASAKLGAAARRRVEENFSLDRMVDEHLALFARLLQSSAGPTISSRK